MSCRTAARCLAIGGIGACRGAGLGAIAGHFKAAAFQRDEGPLAHGSFGLLSQYSPMIFRGPPLVCRVTTRLIVG